MLNFLTSSSTNQLWPQITSFICKSYFIELSRTSPEIWVYIFPTMATSAIVDFGTGALAALSLCILCVQLKAIIFMSIGGPACPPMAAGG